MPSTYNVRDFGAVGDGVADDRPAILAAVNAAKGATVYLPAGVYRLATTLVLPGGTHLLGDGTG